MLNIGSYLGCHFDEVRNHSSSSGVGGTFIVGLSIKVRNWVIFRTSWLGCCFGLYGVETSMRESINRNPVDKQA